MSRLVKLLIAAALSLPIALPIAYSALFAPDIEFLRPSAVASWIVHPGPRDQRFLVRDVRPADVAFSRTFVLDTPPQTFEVHVTALDRFSVKINGETIPAEGPKNWKRGLDLDLAPYLRAGENRLVVGVSYANGVPALLVEADGEVGDHVASDSSWRVRHTGFGSGPVPAARAMRDEGFLDGRESLQKTSPRHAWWRFGLYVLLVFIAYGLVPVRFKPWLREGRPVPASAVSHLAEHGVAIAVFLLVAVIQLHNAATFESVTAMGDTAQHLDYVSYVAEHWRAPLAEEGWQMYHPPLYYFVAAVLRATLSNLSSWFASVEFLRVLNTLFGLANIGFSWLLLRVLIPQRSLARNLGFSLVAMLPMAFYMNPNISNEVFAASLGGATLFASSAFLFDRELQPKRIVLVGILCGLALLSKFSAVFVLVSILTLLVFRAAAAAKPERRVAISKALVGIGAIAVMIAGWFYLRNAIQYGSLFLGNWDYASGFHYEQLPGYRTAGFYTHFGAHLWHVPEWSRWSSFWDGLYGTLWTDAHSFYLSKDDAPVDVLDSYKTTGSLILWLALLPTLGIAVGFVRACRQLFTDGWDHPYFILVTTSFWMLGAIVLFTMRVPFYSTLGAFFALALLPAIGVFAGLGLELLCEQLGRLRYVLYANLLVLYALILYLFSIA